MVAVGAILLAGKGLFAKALYGMGLTFHDVAAIRSVLAVPGFALLAWLYRSHINRTPDVMTHRKDLLLAAAVGLLCYYLGALANFYALTIVAANVERPLLFAYPIFVVLITTLLHRRAPSAPVVLALLLTTMGVTLVTGALNASLTAEQWTGIGWISFCSFTIAIYFLVSAKLTQRLGSSFFTFIAMTSAAVGFLGHYQIARGWQNIDLSGSAWLMLAALIVFSTVLPLLLMAEGVRRVGASRAALISTLGPPATAIMAYYLTGEMLTLSQLAGIGLVIIGVLSLELGRSRHY
ncbi:DMT family transporter [Luminiphilus sp.]|nr:DMT family transporter [Luminiphilus sp.]